MSRYIIAFKREYRSGAPADLAGSVRDIQGLDVCGDPGLSRILVDATPAAIEQVRQLLGDICHIESPIEHEFGEGIG